MPHAQFTCMVLKIFLNMIFLYIGYVCTLKNFLSKTYLYIHNWEEVISFYAPRIKVLESVEKFVWGKMKQEFFSKTLNTQALDTWYVISSSLFWNKMSFMLDEMFQRNASKFDMLHLNTKSMCFILSFSLFPNQCLGICM